MKSPLQWLLANRVMLLNTGSLVGATAVTAGLGFIYWWGAARFYTPDSVGIASAAISAMMLLGSIGMLGLGTLLITELPRQPGQEVSLISTALVVTGCAGAVVGAGFAIIAPFISPAFSPLRASLLDVCTFAAGVSLAAVTTVLDQALIGLLRGGVQFWRNAFFSLVKLLLLLAGGIYLAQRTGMTIYGAWTLGMALSLVLVFIYALFKKGWQGRRYLPQWSLLRKLGLAALQHHLLNLALQIPTQLLPILVTVLLSAKMNAWFYVSWMIANFVLIVPASLTAVLHAMNSAEQSSLRQRARMTIGTAFVVGLVADAVFFLGTKQVLELFGSSYADQATWCLRVLLLAVFPAIIKNHYLSFCRIHDRLGKAMFGMVLGGLLELGCSALGAHLGGLTGLSLGWLAAVMVEGLYMLPYVYSIVWSTKEHVEIPLPGYDGEAQPIWIMDTISLAAVSPLRTTSSRGQTGSLSVSGVWLMDTMMQPVITPVWRAETMALPALSSARRKNDGSATPPPEEHEPIWNAETMAMPVLPSGERKYKDSSYPELRDFGEGEK